MEAFAFMARSPKQNQFTFQGFEHPTTTPVPDVIFDVLLPQLTDAELRVLLYIIRRTFGFKKTTDNISLKQMVEGIRTKDGRTLDSGAGISKASAARGIKGLIAKGIILASRNRSLEKGDEPTTYAIRFKDKPLSQAETGGCLPGRQGGVSQRDTQQTVGQETVRQHDDDVCAALANFGITKKTAQKLAKEYPEDQILTKLDMVNYLVEIKSPLVSKNPQGFLIKALEDGYLPQPPKGYKASGEQEEKQHKEQAERQAVLAAEEESKKLQEEARRQPLEEHLPEPIADTALTTTSAWSKTLSSLRAQVPASSYASWLKDTLLLKLEKNTAFILVCSRIAREWLERRLYQAITRTLEQVIGQPVDVEFVVSQPQ
jgi:hypothetical protein